MAATKPRYVSTHRWSPLSELMEELQNQTNDGETFSYTLVPRTTKYGQLYDLSIFVHDPHPAAGEDAKRLVCSFGWVKETYGKKMVALDIVEQRAIIIRDTARRNIASMGFSRSMDERWADALRYISKED